MYVNKVNYNNHLSCHTSSQQIHQTIPSNCGTNTYNEEIIVIIKFTNSGREDATIKCKSDDTFARVEEKLYQIYPDLRMYNNSFVANGRNVIKFQTLKENQIGNKNIILLLDPLKQGRDLNVSINDHYISKSVNNNSNNNHINKNINNNSISNSLDGKKIFEISLNSNVEKIRNIFHSRNYYNIQQINDLIKTIILNTSYKERINIRSLYIHKYKEDFASIDINGIEKNFLNCFLTSTEYDYNFLISILNQILSAVNVGKGVNYIYFDILTEIIGSRTSLKLKLLKDVYNRQYKRMLENDIAKVTFGEYQKLLLALLQCKRSKSSKADDNKCMNDAKLLYSSGNFKWPLNDTNYLRIFATSSPVELAKINEYFTQYTGKGLIEVINNNFVGNINKLLITIIMSNLDPSGYYASLIHESLYNNLIGVDFSKLYRIIISRNAYNFEDIRQIYKKYYQIDMLDDISNKINKSNDSGHFEVLHHLILNAKNENDLEIFHFK